MTAGWQVVRDMGAKRSVVVPASTVTPYRGQERESVRIHAWCDRNREKLITVPRGGAYQNPALWADPWYWVERDEYGRPGGWSHWLILGAGWCNGFEGSHTIHEPTVAEILERVKEIKPCHCDRCRAVCWTEQEAPK